MHSRQLNAIRDKLRSYQQRDCMTSRAQESPVMQMRLKKRVRSETPDSARPDSTVDGQSQSPTVVSELASNELRTLGYATVKLSDSNNAILSLAFHLYQFAGGEGDNNDCLPCIAPEPAPTNPSPPSLPLLTPGLLLPLLSPRSCSDGLACHYNTMV